jgi:hypothetical protein
MTDCPSSPVRRQWEDLLASTLHFMIPVLVAHGALVGGSDPNTTF